MPEGQKHHEGVAVTVAVLPDGLDQLLDLISGQVLAGAQLRVWCAPGRDCSICDLYSVFGAIQVHLESFESVFGTRESANVFGPW
jgi:hypothetical protein